MIKTGMIGFGKMAQAIVEGWNNAKMRDVVEVYAYAPHQDKLKENCARMHAIPCASPQELCQAVDVIILACKPAQVDGVIEQIAPHLHGKFVISVAAGITHERLAEPLIGIPHVSVMPNTAMAALAGTLIVEEPNTMGDKESEMLQMMFAPLAAVVPVSEALFGIAGTISGCGPAFLGLFAEALADAGVKYGLPRAIAAKLSAQTVYGAGAMLSRDGTEPSVFKNEICSPGGTTIRGIVTLEKDGFRRAVIEAIEAIQEK